MKTIIKKLTLKNFKGVKEASYDISEAGEIFSGKNGSGKTTLATAYYWVFANTDYDLKSNPAVFPMDVEETTPTVTFDLECDGKPVRVEKTQTRKVSKPDVNGISKVSYTNNYSVNEIPLAERDFKTKMAEYGFDMDKFQALSHLDVFTSEKKDEQRKILFSMASSLTDLDVANQTEGASEVAELLKNYTLDEILAMQKATMRKVAEEYGKDGEIINSKIEGLEMAKVTGDLAGIRDLLNGLKADKLNLEIDLKNLEDKKNACAEMQKKSMEYQFEMSKIAQDAHDTAYADKIRATEKVNASSITLSEIQNKIARYEDKISSVKKEITDIVNKVREYTEGREITKRQTFDESAEICPTCKQKLPANMISNLKAEFEDKLKVKVSRYDSVILDTEKARENKKIELKDLEERIERFKAELAEAQVSYKEKKSVQENIKVEEIDLNTIPRYKELALLVEDCKKADAELLNISAMISGVKSNIDEIDCRINLANSDMAQILNNDAIDVKIAKLRDKQREFEQAKADAEMIIDECSQVCRRKNELLTDEINKHFKYVKFEFFEYKKNGNYAECCNLRIDGRMFGESTNTGREILAKLDVIEGLQKFYDMYFPVFVDGFECLSSESIKKIENSCQIIGLKVSETELMKEVC